MTTTVADMTDVVRKWITYEDRYYLCMSQVSVCHWYHLLIVGILAQFRDFSGIGQGLPRHLFISVFGLDPINIKINICACRE